MVDAVAQLTGPPGGAWCHDCGSQEGRGQLVLWMVAIRGSLLSE